MGARGSRRGSEVGLKRKEIKECHQSGLKATEGGAASLASLPLRYILGLWARFGDYGSAVDRNWDTERARGEVTITDPPR